MLAGIIHHNSTHVRRPTHRQAAHVAQLGKCYAAQHHQIEWIQVRSLADGLVSFAARILSIDKCSFVTHDIMDYGMDRAKASIRIIVNQRLENKQLSELELGLLLFLAGVTDNRPPGMDGDFFQDNRLEENTKLIAKNATSEFLGKKRKLKNHDPDRMLCWRPSKNSVRRSFCA